MAFSSVPENRHRVIAIGISTGGPAALQQLFSLLPKNLTASILIVQHITQGFIDGLANHLRSHTGLDIQVAQQGDTLKKGKIYFAPDDFLFRIRPDNQLDIYEDKTTSRLFVPSIDVMMESVAHSCRENAVGVLMTGMGTDGVNGMLAIKEAGGITIAQDEETSAIFGMNKVAITTGCIDYVLSLDKIAEKIADIGCGFKRPVTALDFHSVSL